MKAERSKNPWVMVVVGATAVGVSALVFAYLPDYSSLSVFETRLIAAVSAIVIFAVGVLALEGGSKSIRRSALAVVLIGCVMGGGIVIANRQGSGASPAAHQTLAGASSAPTVSDSVLPAASSDPSPSVAVTAVPKAPEQVEDISAVDPSQERQNSGTTGNQAAAVPVQPCWSVTEGDYRRSTAELLSYWGGPIAEVGTPLKYSVTMKTSQHVPSSSKYPLNIEALQPSCSWKVVATLQPGSSATIDSFVGQEIKASYGNDIYNEDGVLLWGKDQWVTSCIAGIEGSSSGCNSSKKAMHAPY